jgi:hypothetical protein
METRMEFSNWVSCVSYNHFNLSQTKTYQSKSPIVTAGEDAKYTKIR